MVWEQNNLRVVEERPPIDWVVLRNRLTHIDSRNKRDVADLLDKLAHRIGFRVAPGLGERMVYREMFLTGLTVFDLATGVTEIVGSTLAARAEIQSLLEAIGIRETVPA
jgi:chromosome partitioning protein